MSAPNAHAANASFEFGALEEARNYREALMREFGPYLKGSVVELGAGIGQISAMVRALPAVTDFHAIEPDAAFHDRLAGVVGSDRLVRGTLADLPAAVEPDAILSVNVFEHIEDDAGELARAAERLRARRGALCLFVPARPEIYAPIDRDFGHFRRYTRPGLRRALETAGFRIETLKYFNVVGYLAWWWTFRVRGCRDFQRGAVRLFDRVIFPPVYWLESRLTPPPIGQSLLAVARAG